MKGLILAAGLGTRLRPITSVRPKALISVANKPIIVHALDNLVEAGVTDIGIVVSHQTLGHLRNALQDYKNAALTYIMQENPEGLAHAVKVSRDYLQNDPFVMYLGDNLFEHGITSFVDAYDADTCNAVLALIEVEDPRAFGVAVVENGRVNLLVEKPKEPPSNLAVAGIYVFDHTVHEVIEDLPRGAKNEYQITDAIQAMISKGRTIVPVEVKGWWKDTGKPHELLDANRLVLETLQSTIQSPLEDSKLVGEVSVGRNSTIRNTKIVGPVIIGDNCVVDNAYLGPYTSVADGVTIRDAEMEYSIIGENSRIIDIRTRLQSSVVGVDVHVEGRTSRPRTHELILGDKSRTIIQE